MMLLAALLLACAGFAALYLAMSRHQPEALGRRLDERVNRRLRLLGWTGLAAAYLACVGALGWARGSVAIAGVLALGALVVVLFGTYRVRAMAWLARIGTPCALLCLVIAALLR
ncbi:hypothetical protein ASG87_04050 [Frateuria sp. Soil773]|uniref:DUF3325 domain-containing protein n=1 Tax=Frateuria sp. Soil773 TaxID=1736407 RepID=UPI0006F548CC|nr:DUF3325 domain-containing protein [Frateuria sp. Soil773]KRE89507.1 hypothetical protein ASG87_04050 [Frateuria sp. Soil773]